MSDIALHFGPHIESLSQSVAHGCSCEECVTHLIIEIVRHCAHYPLHRPPKYESENGSAAHLRDELVQFAKEIAHQ